MSCFWHNFRQTLPLLNIHFSQYYARSNLYNITAFLTHNQTVPPSNRNHWGQNLIFWSNDPGSDSALEFLCTCIDALYRAQGGSKKGSSICLSLSDISLLAYGPLLRLTELPCRFDIWSGDTVTEKEPLNISLSLCITASIMRLPWTMVKCFMVEMPLHTNSLAIGMISKPQAPSY